MVGGHIIVLTVRPGWGILSPALMSKTRKPAHSSQTGWIIKAMAIPAIIVLVAAFQASPVAAPAPQPTAVLPSTAVPISAPLPQPTATTVPSPTDPPDPPLQKFRPPPTPTLAFADPISMPASAPASDGEQGAVVVPILMYHYISDPPPGSDKYRWALSVTPANMDAQMGYLQKAGYHTITLYDLYDYLTQGKPLPERPIILTFDDGYVDAFTVAMSILQKYGFVGTFFVLTGPADRAGAGGYLTWEQIGQMSAAGMDIELHGREHYDLRNRRSDFLEDQIVGGKQLLEAHLGRPVRWFAYPSGRYDAAVMRAVASAGFWGAVTTIPGRTHTAAALLEMPRVRISGSHTLAAFIKAIASSQ